MKLHSIPRNVFRWLYEERNGVPCLPGISDRAHRTIVYNRWWLSVTSRADRSLVNFWLVLPRPMKKPDNALSHSMLRRLALLRDGRLVFRSWAEVLIMPATADALVRRGLAAFESDPAERPGGAIVLNLTAAGRKVLEEDGAYQPYVKCTIGSRPYSVQIHPDDRLALGVIRVRLGPELPWDNCTVDRIDSDGSFRAHGWGA